jgi:hypothetical protein
MVQPPRTGIYNAYLAQLAAAGAIRLERRKLLGLIPVTEWQVSDTAREAQVRARLDAVAGGTGRVDLADAAFGGLAHAMGLPDRLYPGISRWHLRSRLGEIANGAWTTGPADTGDAGGEGSGKSDAARHAAHQSAHPASTVRMTDQGNFFIFDQQIHGRDRTQMAAGKHRGSGDSPGTAHQLVPMPSYGGLSPR